MQNDTLKLLLDSDEKRSNFFGSYIANIKVWEKMVVYEGSFNAHVILAKAKKNYDAWVASIISDPHVPHKVMFTRELRIRKGSLI